MVPAEISPGWPLVFWALKGKRKEIPTDWDGWPRGKSLEAMGPFWSKPNFNTTFLENVIKERQLLDQNGTGGKRWRILDKQYDSRNWLKVEKTSSSQEGEPWTQNEYQYDGAGRLKKKGLIPPRSPL